MSQGKKNNNRMFQILAVLLLLLLAFGDKILSYLKINNCGCPGDEKKETPFFTPGFNPGNISLEDKSVTVQDHAQVDVELHQRGEDQDLMLLNNSQLEKTFFPNNQTLNLTQTSYAKIY